MKRAFFWENFPPHRRTHLTVRQAMNLYLRGGAVIRYSCPDTEGGTDSFEYVCDNQSYDLASLNSSKARLTRQGLRNCVVRPVDFSTLAEQGCAINQSVFIRQQRPGPAHLSRPDLWKRYMNSCRSVPDIEPWGVFVDDKLCAYMMLVLLDGYAYIYHPYSTTESLPHRPMNALVFTILKEFLRRPEVERVSYGLESFVENPTLEQFKIGMGFRKQPIRRKVLINPLARPFVSRAARGVTRWLLPHSPQSLLLHDLMVFSESVRGRRAA